MHRLLLAALVVTTGCATTSATSTPPPAAKASTPEATRLAITNVIPFDVAACGPRTLMLEPLTNEVLMGALLSLAPAMQECFVDATAREGAAEQKVKVTVAEAAIDVAFTGTGASSSGKACVEGVIKKLPLKGAATAEVGVPVGGAMVQLGENAANDVAGKLRLAQRAQCGCYEKLGAAVPPSLSAAVDVSAEGRVQVTVTGGGELGTCLESGFRAVDLGRDAVKLTWPLLLKNAHATEVDATVPATLRFQQLDGIRGQRAADVVIAAGRRYATATAYDTMARDYKRKPAKGLLDAVKAKCTEVLAADDAQRDAVKALIAVLETSQKLVQDEKTKDAAWEQVEGQLAQQLTASTGEVVRIEAQRKNDEGACPKSK